MNRTKIALAGALALAVIVLAGCGKAPTAEVEVADQTLSRARAAGAAEYAPESLTAAEDARAQLDTELKAQEEKFGLFRSYDKAQELAAASKAAAESAEQDAVEGRNRSRDEAAALIAEVKSSLEEVALLLARAPRGKGSEVDLAMLKSDLSGIEQALVEVDAAFAAERYLEAQAGAQAARDNAERIETEILRAMDTAKPQASRRG